MKSFNLSAALALLLVGCSQHEVHWIAIGDSITYLNDHTAEAGNRVTKGYMTLVAEELPNIRYTNKGYNGWTASAIASEINGLGLVPADVYTVFLGTNDWWRGNAIGTLDNYVDDTGPGTFFGSLRSIIEALRELNADARIILITPMQRVDFVYVADMSNNAHGSYREKNGQLLSEFADAILKVASHEKLEVVDLYYKSGITHENLVKFKRLRDPASGQYRNFRYPGFIDIPFNPQTDNYPYPIEAIDMSYDGLHPSDAGNEVIAGMIIEKLKD